MKVGDVVWRMRAKRKNDTIKWFAEPKCIEYLDERKFFYADGCGGSLSNIGKIVFESKEECETAFLKEHDGFEEHIDINSPSPEDVEDSPRTDWQTYVVTRFDSIEHTSVYLGGLNDLKDVSDTLEWHTQWVEGLYMDVGTLSLSEIYEQLKERNKEREIITVIQNDPMRCEIFQCGNYDDGKWYRLGEIMGYA